jgi:hypothetical protein
MSNSNEIGAFRIRNPAFRTFHNYGGSIAALL